MDIQTWCIPRNRGARCSPQCFVKGDSGHFMLFSLLVARSKRERWALLWRKMAREKRKLFGYYYSAPPVHVPYDPYTYSQNFDQGTMWGDPDIMSRSFSARFAVPSRIFEKSTELLN